ncbi:serine hydrolase domain-containing protein [Steroidobacter cummioxidans]|uniref:serine hydrolase domain-containing protein n=1 Tax=Steroidobacter cummioxidans TaxID=1803913 RepID=UPI000E31241A|nr:serine hydrolase domain-containing protein [Steroidobacter cummioxidans]
MTTLHRSQDRIEWADISKRLPSAAPRKGELILGFTNGQERHFAVVGSSGLNMQAAGTQLTRIGCAVKLFTASLMDLCVRRGDVSWEDRAQRFFTARLPVDMTIRQLLDHTHSLDDSLLPGAPRLADDKLDVAELCNRLGAMPPLSTPGKLCSYGNAGCWLAGGVLERIHGKCYGELLSEQLLRPLNFTAHMPAGASTICPSVAEELDLRACDILSFLELCFQQEGRDAPFNPRALMRDPIALPGWSPSEQGTCIGWKSFGCGWFGHNSHLPGHITVIRVNPESRTGLLLYGSEATLAAFTRTFATMLPEFSLSRLPRTLDPARLATVRLSEYEGSFANAALRVVVRSIDGTLHYQAVENHVRSAETHSAPQPLIAAENHMFLPAARPFAPLQVLQFVPDAHGTFDHIWNGRNLLRRQRIST